MACTKAQVQKMLDHINCRQAHNDSENTNMPENKLEYPLFKGWDMIIGKKAELMVGNYRVEALKEYLRHLKSSKNEQ